MKKFDKGYIFYHLLTDFFISLFLTFSFTSEFVTIIDEETEEIIGYNYGAIPFVIIAFVLLYAAFTTYRILFRNLSGYTLTEKDIRCKRGVLFRRNSIVEYARIHAVNKKQNIFQRFFGIAVLTIDSGSANTAHTAEITVVERSALVDALLSDLRALRAGGERRKEDEEKSETLLSKSDALYRFTSPKKFLYSLISITTAATFVGVLCTVCVMFIGISKEILSLDFLGTLGQYVMWSVIITLGAMLVVALVTFITAVIQSFIGYYDFKIERRDKDIVISYGLLERHINSLSYDRIRGVKITQGVIQRALGFAAIKLEVIGYTSESDSNNTVTLGVLVPFCRIEEVEDILDKILPEYKPDGKQTSSPALFPHLSWFSLILGIATAMVAVSTLVPMVILDAGSLAISIAASAIAITAALVFLIKLGSALLAYKTAGIAILGDKITAYSGGYIKQITVIKARDVSSVERITTPLREKAGIASALIHMRTNAMSNEVRVPIQKSEAVDTLKEFMPR